MTGFPDRPDRRDNSPAPSGPSPSYPYPELYQYGPYLPPPYRGGTPHAVAPRNGLGIASLVLAVIALLSVATVFAPIALGVVAIVLGGVGHRRVTRGTANNGGVAIAGIVLGGLAIIVGLAFIAIWTTVWKDVGGGDYIDCMQKAGTAKFGQQQCADEFRQNVHDKLSVTLTPTPIR